jgi:hypothetical protein
MKRRRIGKALLDELSKSGDGNGGHWARTATTIEDGNDGHCLLRMPSS